MKLIATRTLLLKSLLGVLLLLFVPYHSTFAKAFLVINKHHHNHGNNVVELSFQNKGSGSLSTPCTSSLPTLLFPTEFRGVHRSNRYTKKKKLRVFSKARSTSRLYTNLRGGGDGGLSLDVTNFNKSCSIFAIANFVGFLISVISPGTQVHLDLIGTGVFALSTLPTLLQFRGNNPTVNPRIRLSSLCVSAWSVKLASFLFFRANVIGHDQRLESLLSTVPGSATFWMISLTWGIICSLPHGLGTIATNHRAKIGSIEILGTIVYTIGLFIESIADYQKWTFKSSNPGMFCNVGLWSVSQHPNFFGNLLLWLGIFILNGPALIDPAPVATVATASPIKKVFSTVWRCKRLFIAMLSPLFMWSLFSSQATEGSAMSSVELANQKYGSDPEYQKYVTSVPLIIPNIFGVKE